MSSGISAVAAGGLTLDIAGALLLAYALITRSPTRAVAEGVSAISFNLELDMGKARETIDARVGALLLVAGFGGQLAADVGFRASTGLEAADAIVAALIVDIAAVLLAITLRRRQIRMMLFARLERADDVGEWWPICHGYGLHLGRPAPADIGTEVPMVDYFASLLGPKLWARFSIGRSFPDVYTKLRRELAGTDEYRAAHPGED